MLSENQGYLAAETNVVREAATGLRVVGRQEETVRMKVSGFTFVRNVVKYDYPVVESIRSILPIVDEFIVNVGRCEDGTLELIRSIGDPKIKIVESVWDETLRKD